MVWTPPLRPLRSDTKAPVNSIPNTAVSSASHPCGIFGLSARQALCPSSRSVIGKALSNRFTKTRIVGWVVGWEFAGSKRRHILVEFHRPTYLPACLYGPCQPSVISSRSVTIAFDIWTIPWNFHTRVAKGHPLRFSSWIRLAVWKYARKGATKLRDILGRAWRDAGAVWKTNRAFYRSSSRRYRGQARGPLACATHGDDVRREARGFPVHRLHQGRPHHGRVPAQGCQRFRH